ncbi:hypothetical protein AAE478_008009 [Parahypoxylon ruwenzoriense]
MKSTTPDLDFLKLESISEVAHGNFEKRYVNQANRVRGEYIAARKKTGRVWMTREEADALQGKDMQTPEWI